LLPLSSLPLPLLLALDTTEAPEPYEPACDPALLTVFLLDMAVMLAVAAAPAVALLSLAFEIVYSAICLKTPYNIK
jgi:hypothetical protein